MIVSDFDLGVFSLEIVGTFDRVVFAGVSGPCDVSFQSRIFNGRARSAFLGFDVTSEHARMVFNPPCVFARTTTHPHDGRALADSRCEWTVGNKTRWKHARSKCCSKSDRYEHDEKPAAWLCVFPHGR